MKTDHELETKTRELFTMAKTIVNTVYESYGVNSTTYDTLMTITSMMAVGHSKYASITDACFGYSISKFDDSFVVTFEKEGTEIPSMIMDEQTFTQFCWVMVDAKALWHLENSLS